MIFPPFYTIVDVPNLGINPAPSHEVEIIIIALCHKAYSLAIKFACALRTLLVDYSSDFFFPFAAAIAVSLS